MIDLGERKKTGSPRLVNTAPAEADVGNTKSRSNVVGYCWSIKSITDSYGRGSNLITATLRISYG